MRASQFSGIVLAGIFAALWSAWPAWTGEPQAARPQAKMQTQTGEKALVIKSLPSKKLVGTTVMNKQGEKLGTIDDLVIDLESGKVVYAALSVGGVLGIGDKLFAVPFEEFKTAHDTSNNVSFVLDASKDRLANAPGFDKDHWPDFAGREWRDQIDTYYHRSAARPGERKE